MNANTGKQESYQKIVAMVMAVIITFLAFLIIRPFIVAILSAAALSYVFYPLYRYFAVRIKRTAASILTCLIIVLIVLIPTITISTVMTYELRGGYSFIQELLQSPGFSLPHLPQNLEQMMGGGNQVKLIIGDLAGQVIDWLQGILKRIPNLFLSILITVFSTYYFLKHGKDIYEFFKNIFPLPKERYKQILSRFDDLSRGMIMGQIVVGIVQGVLAWAGFLFVGVPNPVLWGFLTALISIIPLLGAAMVWLPIDIYLFLMAYAATGEYWRAIVLFFYGIFVVSTIDNFLKPKIVGDRANIHPLVILFGILGGVQLFGIPGIIIGPLILTLFDLVIEIYRESL
ncbi:MAG: AI-2E family transporter [Candidatus Margulisiibacteriota bacterium]